MRNHIKQTMDGGHRKTEKEKNEIGMKKVRELFK